MKALALALVMLASACAAKTSPDPTPTEAAPLAAQPYCAHFEGRSALQSSKCPAGQTMQNARCDVTGGVISSQGLAYGSWECQATWDNPVVGGELCITVVCE